MSNQTDPANETDRSREWLIFLTINLVVPYAAKRLVFPFIAFPAKLWVFYLITVIILLANTYRARRNTSFRWIYAAVIALNLAVAVLFSNLSIFTAFASIALPLKTVFSAGL